MNNLIENLQHAYRQKDFEALDACIPYAQFMGVKTSMDDKNRLVFSLPFSDHNVGNIVLQALHGGLIGGFLENAAFVEIACQGSSLDFPKVIDFSLDYLRSAKPETTYARCEIIKLGKRVAHTVIYAWQSNEENPLQWLVHTFC